MLNIIIYLRLDNKRNMHIIRCLLREREREREKNRIALISVIISYVGSKTRVDYKGLISHSLDTFTRHV